MKIRNLCLIGLFAISTGLAPSTGHARLGDFFDQVKKSFGVGGLSEQEIVLGLKDALRIGTGNAVVQVSKIGGYYGNPKIKIPLPDSVQKVERLVRAAGFGAEIDAFEMSMNRAAERAAPEAKGLFREAVEKMSFSDAKKILQGGNNEAPLYFKDNTFDKLKELARPIIHGAMGEVGVTSIYQDLDKKVRKVPFAGTMSFDLDEYVTHRALDGLFLMVAEEERKIREDPAARVTELLKKVFGSK